MSAATGGNVWEGIKFGAVTGFVTGATYGTIKGIKEYKAIKFQTTRRGVIPPQQEAIPQNEKEYLRNLIIHEKATPE